MGAEPALALRGVAKLYGRTAALRAITLRLEAGESLTLLGPNGSGKTTLLKIVAGAITPTVGSGSILGRDMVRDRLDLRAEIGLMAAETYLYEDLSALENLRFIATMAGRRTRERDLRSAVDEVGLAHQAGHRVRTFSSGMKRRLVLARLLVLRPRLLLLDEPYNSLDAAATGLVEDLVRRTLEADGAAILATHDAARGLALSDRVAVLERGSLAYVGSALDYGVRDAHHVG